MGIGVDSGLFVVAVKSKAPTAGADFVGCIGVLENASKGLTFAGGIFEIGKPKASKLAGVETGRVC
jgi:hypothetical protein